MKRSEPFKNWPVPIVIKLHADSKAHALVGGLEELKKQGQIDDFHIEEGERPVLFDTAPQTEALAEHFGTIDALLAADAQRPPR